MNLTDDCLDKDLPRTGFLGNFQGGQHCDILFNVFHTLAKLEEFEIYSGMVQNAVTFLVVFHEKYYGPLDPEKGLAQMEQKWIDKIESSLFHLCKYYFVTFGAMKNNQVILRHLMQSLNHEQDYMIMSQLVRVVYLMDNHEWDGLRDYQWAHDFVFCLELEKRRVECVQYLAETYVKIKKQQVPPHLKPGDWEPEYTGHKTNQFCEALKITKESDEFCFCKKQKKKTW